MEVARFVSVSFITENIDAFLLGLGRSEEASPDEVCVEYFLDAKPRPVAAWTLPFSGDIDKSLKSFSWQETPVAAEVAGLNLRLFFKALQVKRADELSADDLLGSGVTGHVALWAGDSRDVSKTDLAAVQALKSSQPKFALYVQDRLGDWEASSVQELMDLSSSGDTQDYRDVTAVC